MDDKAIIEQQRKQIEYLGSIIARLQKTQPTFKMTGEALSKLSTEERNNIIVQLGPIEIMVEVNKRNNA